MIREQLLVMMRQPSLDIFKPWIFSRLEIDLA